MPEIFLHKIRKIILENIENDKFGVSDLAEKLNLSRSQLLRKIKADADISANQYIRDIRLEQAVELLKKAELNASEIAYKTGFSSPSYFNKCFHEKFGYTPGDFKRNREKLEPEPEKKNIKINRGWYWMGAALAICTLLAFFIFNILVAEKKEVAKYKSIAVLPLLDLSENKNKDFLSIGLTDAITLQLSHLKGLRVISRGSSMLYRDSLQLYSEIARKLGVDLLLEGSIIYGGDSLRVTVQLIHPYPQEGHVWANSYDQRATNILQLSHDISSQIAKEIHFVLNRDQNKASQRQFSAEALESYLRGKMLWQKQNPESVEDAIQYLNEAIKLEPDFAQAYCTLAEAYMSKNKMFPGNNEEKLKNKMQSKNAINHALNRALELDGSLAEAYITKGMMLRKIDWDWEGMKKMAEKGLQLNPNNKDGYMLLSDYYLVKGMLKKSIQNALLAEDYDPLNPRIGCLVAERYMYAGLYEEAIRQYRKVFELYPRYSFAWDGVGFAHFLNGDKEQAKNSWLELHKTMGNNHMAEYFQQNDFNNSVNYIISKFAAGDKLYCSNPPIIAMAHILVNRKEGALKYLEIAREYRNEDLPVLMLSPVFEPLYSEERYLGLANQLNVSINHQLIN